MERAGYRAGPGPGTSRLQGMSSTHNLHYNTGDAASSLLFYILAWQAGGPNSCCLNIWVTFWNISYTGYQSPCSELVNPRNFDMRRGCKGV